MADNRDAEASETVKDQAALWVARLRGGNCTLQDERSFRAWLTADASHVTAFEAMHATWEIAAAIPRDPVRFGYKPSRKVARREFLWTAGALAVAGGAFATWQAAAAKEYDTKVGEQRHIVLPDGSLMFLDTDTHVSFRMRDNLRLTQLRSGRANFRIRPDGNRPFRVEAGQQAVTTPQSRLDILHDGHMTSVTLLDGQASIDIGRPGGEQKVSLRGGERVRISDAAVARDRPNLSSLLAWQRGQVVFDNSTLKQAAAELNRYSEMKLVVEDPIVASWRVSGVFLVGDNYAFVKAASKFLPLGMIQTSGHILLVQDPPRARLG